jgi:hypothetical protein
LTWSNSEEPIYVDFLYVQIAIDFVFSQLITIPLDVPPWQARKFQGDCCTSFKSQAYLTNDWL